jgi:hypothetical protein
MPVYLEIIACILVTLGAVGLLAVRCSGPSALHVFEVCYGLQMGRVAAVAMDTTAVCHMVNLKPLGDRSDDALVHPAVHKFFAIAGHADAAVAVARLGAHPQPTARRVIDNPRWPAALVPREVAR